MYASDWFESDLEFRQLCLDAISLARVEAAEEFAHEMAKKAKEHGLKTYLSERQMRWLCQIADHEWPKKREGAK